MEIGGQKDADGGMQRIGINGEGKGSRKDGR